MRSIEGFGPMTQILTHFSGKTCHLGPRVGETVEEVEIAGTPLTVGFGRSLTQPDEICEWRDRRDSNPKLDNAQCQSEKGIPPLRSEALTQILTHFSGKDRQMLTQIVKRWGSLSDELKRAVLRMVG
jgi:hypothetical protein